MIDIQVNAGETLQAFLRLQEGMQRMSEPMNEAAILMERETKENFARQSSPEGQPWAALSPSTLRYKRGAILRETSTLVGSVAKLPVTNDSATIEASQSYGLFHQTGTSKMPQRKFIGFAPRHEQQIQQIFERWLQGVMD